MANTYLPILQGVLKMIVHPRAKNLVRRTKKLKIQNLGQTSRKYGGLYESHILPRVDLILKKYLLCVLKTTKK